MTRTYQTYRLTERNGGAVACDRTGLFVGETPLLERASEGEPWRPRSRWEINLELSRLYGLPVDIAAKQAGLASIASALSDGDIPRAQVAALNLQLPEPPGLSKRARSDNEIIELTGRLIAARLLAKTWDEQQHPRWPAGSLDSAGGQFAPAGSGGGSDSLGSEDHGRAIPTGFVEPLPSEPFDASGRELAAAINGLRAGDGTRTVKAADGASLTIRRSGSKVSLTTRGVTLTGGYNDPPGALGVDIEDVRITTTNPGASFKALPDKPGGSTALRAEIRVVREVAGHTRDGRPTYTSALNVRYDHTVVWNEFGVEAHRWDKGQFYGF